MPTCQGKTKDGRPCSRSAEDGALYCWQHKPDEPATRLVDADGKPLPEVYELLAKATPEEKTDIVLRLIEEHPKGKLELLPRNGMCADLRRIDLSRRTLKARWIQSNHKSPSWWDAGSERVNLRGANLQEARINGANLRDANRQEAGLWEVEIGDADLRGADLQGADLKFANLQGAILWNTNLQNADLGYTTLKEASLRRANLRKAVLWSADLGGADLRDTILGDADLRHARLQGVDLSISVITGIYVSDAWLDKTKLRWEQLGGAIGEELVARQRGSSVENRVRPYGEAKLGYMVLKQNFESFGDYNAASEAYRKERRMEKWETFLQARIAFRERRFRDVGERCRKVFFDELEELTCDYGESVKRVLTSLLVVYVLFTLIYGLTWSVMRVSDTPTALIKEPTRNLVDLARFSLGAMTTIGPAGLEPRNGLVELVAGLEALLGIALTGLLGFVLGNRVRRS